jgi:hypothetical protein
MKKLENNDAKNGQNPGTKFGNQANQKNVITIHFVPALIR